MLTLDIRSLRLFLASVPLVGIAIVGSVYFQAINRGGAALIVTLVRQLVVLVPLYLVLPRYLGLDGIWLAGPLSDAVAVVLTIVLLVPEMRRLARAKDASDLQPKIASQTAAG